MVDHLHFLNAAYLRGLISGNNDVAIVCDHGYQITEVDAYVGQRLLEQ